MSIFSVLICVVSFVLQSPISLNIHNQCQGIDLTSPIYFIHGGKWHAIPDLKIDFDTVMLNRLEFDPGQDILEGALVYKIQIKHAESREFPRDESKQIQLLVAWRIEYTRGLYVRAFLVEHGNEFNWDKDKLKRLYQKYWHVLKSWLNPTEFNWLLNDAMMLETTIKTMNEGYNWDIFISEGISNHFDRPFRIDEER
jgi:hypothetical protein